MGTYPELINIVGRILLVSYFLKAAVFNSINPTPIINLIKAKKFPLPTIVFLAVLVIQVFGGLAIIFNFYPILGAIGLIGFTALSNILFCNFWAMEGIQARVSTNLFFANIAIIGGLIVVLSS